MIGENADERGHARWRACAVCIGYNELAKLATTLGEKTYFRLLRDHSVGRFVELGGNANLFAQEGAVVEIVMPEGMPFIRFHERDIEMMRKAVEEHDGLPAADDLDLSRTAGPEEMERRSAAARRKLDAMRGEARLPIAEADALREVAGAARGFERALGFVYWVTACEKSGEPYDMVEKACQALSRLETALANLKAAQR